tara:strand:+ start:4178 stop:4885 length:708 start_codon:yes stop_codon:yes gene_type:complete
MNLTILIPVKNEEMNIEGLVLKIKKELKIDYEILFIDDFSSDNTYSKIIDIKKIEKNVFVIKNKIQGLGESIRNGIKFSNGEYLTIFMSDGSDDLNNLNDYFNLIKNNNLDAVFGSRFLSQSVVKNYPKTKYYLNRLFNNFISLIYLNKYNDYTNAFKIYKKESLLSIQPIVSESFNVFLELPLKIINRKLKYEIVPINWSGREKGNSKFKIKELRSKYLFTLIYCFAEKILLLK